jgi:RalA-binding protein 1
MITSNTNNLYATPTRERLPVPPGSSSQSFASPVAAVRATPTSSAMLPSSSSVTQNQPVTVDSLLQTHANASSPPLAALEQAVSERNLLSSQNSQLWKLIEKSRSGYNHLLKDLERVRGERDAYKSKAQALAANMESSAWNEGERNAMSNSASQGVFDASASSSSSSSSSPSVSRLVPTRARSEDQSMYCPCLTAISFIMRLQ